MRPAGRNQAFCCSPPDWKKNGSRDESRNEINRGEERMGE